MLYEVITTGALFLLVGFLEARHGTASVAAFGGLQKVVPVFAGTFLIVGLSALALPGMSPFASEIMVLVGSYEAARWAVIVAALGVIRITSYNVCYTKLLREYMNMINVSAVAATLFLGGWRPLWAPSWPGYELLSTGIFPPIWLIVKIWLV